MQSSAPWIWLLEHLQGSCLHVPVSRVAHEAQSLLHPSRKAGSLWLGLGSNIAVYQPSLLPCRPGIWGAHCRGLDRDSPVHIAWVGCPVPAQPWEASVSAVAFSLWVSFCFRELWRGFLFLPVAAAETHPPSSQFLFHLIITFYYLQSP